MSYDDFRAIRVTTADGVARVTLDHPPINLLDLELILEQYVATENNHTRSALNSHAGSGGPKIEVF